MRRLIALLATLTLAGVLAPAVIDAPASAAPATHVVVVRPVTAQGRPAPGWTVHRQKGAVFCDDASRSAVDDGIATCYPSAYYLPSCWRSVGHTVLCVRDVGSRELVRIRYRGAYPDVTAPRRPSPQELTLGNGETCTIRIGGAWGTAPSHPRWLGFYSCESGSVYGPPNGDGIDRGHHPWWVHVMRDDRSMVLKTVRTAYVVGTAA